MSENRQLSVREQKFMGMRAYLTKAGKSLGMVLPKHLTPDRMIRIALTACTKTPKLLDATPESMCLALLNASETGLEPNGRDACLVPYQNKQGDQEAQFQLMYQGMVQLAFRSGLLGGFQANVVYEDDQFSYAFGTDYHLRHVPSEKENPGKLRLAYAVAKLKDGAMQFVVLHPRDIARARSSSKTAHKPDSPWKQHEAAMWIKTAAKQLCKWLPRSAEMQRALDLDDQAEIGVRQLPEAIDIAGLIEIPEDGGQLDTSTAQGNARESSLNERLKDAPADGDQTKSGQSQDKESATTAADPKALLKAKITNLLAMGTFTQARKEYDKLMGPEGTIEEDWQQDIVREVWAAREAKEAEKPEKSGKGKKELFDKGQKSASEAGV